MTGSSNVLNHNIFLNIAELTLHVIMYYVKQMD